MILVVDLHYKEDDSAKAVGILCEWEDKEAIEIIIEQLENVEPYVPGEFYKRELPGILKIIERVEFEKIEAIIVDGHVYVDNDKNYGLGGYLWEQLKKKTPVIGVAKRGFYSNKETVIEVIRGNSKNPLYVSAVGVDKEIAARQIQIMKGDYRIPTILKKVDSLTKSSDE
ncbi:endonuclease V [Nonlabens xylanidelens]|uniref:Endonuclease V n=1 Tax=Nonlabens xylanidelens TaxID=191564 RepID=A0A2S6IPR1_9FLAO|nr:endonuclease V [Nonlabens xylanidelens]PPK96233.1 endonuclease V [Nonlabens xylanidelens]PQJ17971.1 endonuclease V [Nonlabens xylanidelens]